ncbi:hypothetical protein [Planktothrix pseudagardhii]|uniref:Uncharacterized protein n=1 Tax=Planktothrix pseudagardhii TaxID=132604 RepID=A0A9W4CUU4_9CYAN|nr:hypothetical protein [Planktothrix pseudagardhii]CAD5922597.1 hypothetical protein NO713_00760 [Planktothrix pseudagardhii]
MYTYSQDFEVTINIAIALLKDKNVNNLSILKNFLSFIPNPNHIKEVLIKAVQAVVNTCPQTTLWLLQHPHCLEPEVNVRDVIHQEISNKLLFLGLTLEDFTFDSEGYLVFPDSFKTELLKSSKIPLPNEDITLILTVLRHSDLDQKEHQE